MNSVVHRDPFATRALLISAALAVTTGCAHKADQQAVAQEKQVAALQARLDEAERTNGRLNVRIEELEDDVFLLQDRVDANRIALQRRGIMGTRAQASAQLAPAPETHWNQPRNPVHNRPVTRIPLGQPETEPQWQVQDESRREEPTYTNVAPTAPQQAEAELVITDKEFNDFSKQYGGPSAKSSGTRKAQPPVTSEKLTTTAQSDGQQAAQPKPAPKSTARKDALGTYKDALASYRGGEYSAALTGFQTFLAGGPQPDYLDNALYWIGECHFGLGQYGEAVSFFQRVMQEQPDGNKVPDAMLKMSLAYDRTGRGAEATRLLEDLTRQYPATNAGRLAAQKLEERK